MNTIKNAILLKVLLRKRSEKVVIYQTLQGAIGSLCTLFFMILGLCLVLDALPGHKGKLSKRFVEWVMSIPITMISLLIEGTISACQKALKKRRGGKEDPTATTPRRRRQRRRTP